MKEVYELASQVLRPLGYSKKAGRFSRIQNVFYQLIDFQNSVYRHTFYVNVCTHPVGLPDLMTRSEQLVIKDKPPQHECFFRQRIEQIVQTPATATYRIPGPLPDYKTLALLLQESLATDVQQWLLDWSLDSRIAHSSQQELHKMITIVPIYWSLG